MNSANTDYSSVANLYDSLGHLYSGGQIAATKASQINHISTGDRVLYAGVGGGEDARLAAKAGAKVTVVDLSQAMLDRAIVGFERAGVRDDIEVICGDIMEHARHGYYDVVVANFFLNVFDTELMPQVMKHLALQLRDGGTFMIDCRSTVSAALRRVGGPRAPAALLWVCQRGVSFGREQSISPDLRLRPAPAGLRPDYPRAPRFSALRPRTVLVPHLACDQGVVSKSLSSAFAACRIDGRPGRKCATIGVATRMLDPRPPDVKIGCRL